MWEWFPYLFSGSKVKVSSVDHHQVEDGDNDAPSWASMVGWLDIDREEKGSEVNAGEARVKEVQVDDAKVDKAKADGAESDEVKVVQVDEGKADEGEKEVKVVKEHSPECSQCTQDRGYPPPCDSQGECAVCGEASKDLMLSTWDQGFEQWTRSGCQHKFCRTCMKGWVKAQLDGFSARIKCPQEGCKKLLLAGDVHRVDVHLYDRYV